MMISIKEIVLNKKYKAVTAGYWDESTETGKIFFKD